MIVIQRIALTAIARKTAMLRRIACFAIEETTRESFFAIQMMMGIRIPPRGIRYPESPERWAQAARARSSGAMAGGGPFTASSSPT